MKRSAFLGTALLGALGASAAAQQPGGVRRIGVLNAGAASDPSTPEMLTTFRLALQALGWTEGRNVELIVRFANGDDGRIPALAAELVSEAPDAILAMTPPVVAALKRRTHTIPIVFLRVSDPVGQGFVASLARPGGNVTGFTDFDYSTGTKWLQLLKEIAPRVTRVVVAFHPENGSSRGFLHAVEAAAKPAGVKVGALCFGAWTIFNSSQNFNQTLA